MVDGRARGWGEAAALELPYYPVAREHGGASRVGPCCEPHHRALGRIYSFTVVYLVEQPLRTYIMDCALAIAPQFTVPTVWHAVYTLPSATLSIGRGANGEKWAVSCPEREFVNGYKMAYDVLSGGWSGITQLRCSGSDTVVPGKTAGLRQPQISHL